MAGKVVHCRRFDEQVSACGLYRGAGPYATGLGDVTCGRCLRSSWYRSEVVMAEIATRRSGPAGGSRIRGGTMKLVAGKNIPVCSDVAKELSALSHSVRSLEQKLRAGGLHERAEALRKLADGMGLEATKLDFDARNSYFAARQGRELPG